MHDSEASSLADRAGYRRHDGTRPLPRLTIAKEMPAAKIPIENQHKRQDFIIALAKAFALHGCPAHRLEVWTLFLFNRGTL